MVDKTIEEVACEVIRWEWGRTEAEQKSRLEKQGYNYEEMKKLIQQIRNS